MEFGAVRRIDLISFDLPDDAPRTEKFLSLLEGEGKIRVGCPIWGSNHWVGSIYPPGARSADYLSYYSRQFDFIEVNSTFYRTPSPTQVQKWKSQTPADFKFCPKLFRGITEDLASPDLSARVREFADSILQFEDQLGLCLAQLPPSFGAEGLPVLERFLRLAPQDLRLAVEFRHPSWFVDHRILDPAINLLYRHGAATAVTDTPGRRDVLHTSLCQPRVLIRFQGFELHPTDFERMDHWADRLADWAAQGMEEIYFCTHQPGDERIPATARAMRERVEKVAPWALVERMGEQPRPGQIDLFSESSEPRSPEA